ncbi:MAG TPA: RNA methyltransferase [Burkholderiales bacterium]
MTVLRSRDNPKVKRWMRLASDGRFRRKEGRALIEGPHLVEAGLDQIKTLFVVEGDLSGEIRSLVNRSRLEPVVLSRNVFNAIADAESPQGVAAEIAIPPGAANEKADSVFLEGIQDAGNVGAIIRSAAAFGVKAVYLDKACADPWSPKALRAGMGGHFQLAVMEGTPPEGKRLVCTVVKGGVSLKEADLSGPLCWVFGSEGQGVSPGLQRKAALRVSIPVAPRTESLNVAAAAAVCLYETHARRDT